MGSVKFSVGAPQSTLPPLSEDPSNELEESRKDTRSDLDDVPKVHEGESEEEAEGAPELGHQRGRTPALTADRLLKAASLKCFKNIKSSWSGLHQEMVESATARQF